MSDDPRIEAIATARAAYFWPNKSQPDGADRHNAAEFIMMADAYHAAGGPPHREEVMSDRPCDRQADTCASASADKSAAPLAGADPPWIEILERALNVNATPVQIANARATLRELRTKQIDIVFDGPPAPESGRFIEVESPPNVGIKFGEWIKRSDDFWVLRFSLLTFAARQPREITDAMVEAAAVVMCCGTFGCDAVNACVGHDISADGYAEKYGCLSIEKQREVRAVLEAALRAENGK